MSYEHWFEDCTEHENCVVHIGKGKTVIDGEEHDYVTDSHASSEIDPATRLNPDYPEAMDRRKGRRGTIKRKAVEDGSG